MKNLQETMKQLQKASESLSKLSLDHEHPWKALSQMNQILDANFWDHLTNLTTTTASHATQQAGEIIPAVSKQKKKAKEQQPMIVSRSNSNGFPAMDIFQTEHLVILCCELPGFARDSLEVTLTEQRTLELKGMIKKPDHNRSCILQERAYGAFYRLIELPVSVSAKGMKAQYEDGILELYLPRDGTPKERKTTFRAKL
ncbi:Hsp20/alpha crystallin family protein [Brevibacillus choshinensis]|uniref:Hsp20/alpha crystallin family protein n=1 Tax=Brevibacillus choshinensis TaxID=54911 RepID=A0ABX7FK90_BRECH|nr:Hsp20/alpha crystallin family protein [Brevibacillus choshinensis]QRG65737.1 Hsp20/alpha crystallin family protein [Brevibacillus choshinensis]